MVVFESERLLFYVAPSWAITPCLWDVFAAVSLHFTESCGQLHGAATAKTHWLRESGQDCRQFGIEKYPPPVQMLLFLQQRHRKEEREGKERVRFAFVSLSLMLSQPLCPGTSVLLAPPRSYSIFVQTAPSPLPMTHTQIILLCSRHVLACAGLYACACP